MQPTAQAVGTPSLGEASPGGAKELSGMDIHYQIGQNKLGNARGLHPSAPRFVVDLRTPL